MAENQLAARPRIGALPRRRRHGGFGASCIALALAIAVIGLTRVGRAEAHRNADASSRSSPGAVASAPPTTRETSSNATIQRLIRSGQPIYCGGETERLVALTFDDGPGVDTLGTIAELRRAGMTATFFEVGKLLGESRFAGIPRAAASFGAVGDHTWDHISVVGLSRDELAAEIDRTRTALEQLTGRRVFLFRPPLGQHDATVDTYLRSVGMLEVLWSIDTRDSQGATHDQIFAAVRAHLSPGDIILLHENRGTTQKALPRIIDLIRRRGYQAVTVPQLLAMDPPSAEQLRTHTCS
jgi:peptidoglycan-N-acetylglucosamine deacetylase